MVILVLTKSKHLGQKLRLLLSELGNVIVEDNSRYTGEYDHLIVDIDTMPDTDVATVKLSANGKADAMPIPFVHEDILKRLTESKKNIKRLDISKDGRFAILDGKKIRLTELESRLLAELNGTAGYISRDTILKRIWGSGTDEGIVNVYIHYLREKLEADGEKIIISSRKLGYKIDEKYKQGDNRC